MYIQAKYHEKGRSGRNQPRCRRAPDRVGALTQSAACDLPSLLPRASPASLCLPAPRAGAEIEISASRVPCPPPPPLETWLARLSTRVCSAAWAQGVRQKSRQPLPARLRRRHTRAAQARILGSLGAGGALLSGGQGEAPPSAPREWGRPTDWRLGDREAASEAAGESPSGGSAAETRRR